MSEATRCRRSVGNRVGRRVSVFLRREYERCFLIRINDGNYFFRSLSWAMKVEMSAMLCFEGEGCEDDMGRGR